MKQTILHFSLCFFTLGFAFSSQSQVTIDQSNFLRGTTYTDTLALSTTSSLGAPSEGADQVWDYSSLVAGSFEYTDHYGVTNHPDFPNATTYYQNDLSFQGFPIQNFNYEKVDATGWSIVGQAITDVTYSITAITGGPNDSLRFVGNNYSYPVPNDLINFPMNYEDQWTTEITGYTPYELTVTAFGLNKTPGTRKRTITHDRSIVGYGKLIIPTMDGTASAPMDVLLMKTVLTAVDSVFLGGAPAPAPLMAAFGLTQGSTASVTSYLFYKPGFGSAVLAYDSDEPNMFFFRPQSADVVSGTRDIQLMEVKHFPNPIAAGQTLTIETENAISAGFIRMVDVNGRLVQEIGFETNSGNYIQVKIPATLAGGLYMYQLQGMDRKLIGAGKLLAN